MMVYGVKELNFALKSLITFLSLSNIFLRTTAFSTPPFSTLSCESGVSKSVLFLNGSNNEIQFETDRRDLLGKSLKSFAIVGVGLSVANVQDASAAFNTRIGGLPNKIRNICVVMVSIAIPSKYLILIIDTFIKSFTSIFLCVSL